MCGKDCPTVENGVNKPGSPPHVRERPTSSLNGGRDVGITPACAGKTMTIEFSVNSVRDHPRMCGKDSTLAITPFVITGSPPHVRERRIMEIMAQSNPRITPACAGKTQMQKP